MFDVDADLAANDTAGQSPNAPRCRSCRLMLPPCQAKSKAYTGEIDDNIKDTHLQHNLKRHPSAQAWKGQVCYSFLFRLSVRYMYIMCTDGQLFIDFVHRVLTGFTPEGLGLHFPFTCFTHLLMRTIAPC